MARCWVLALLLGACGPIAYYSDVTRSAANAVEAAKAAQADQYAPYYYTRATEYLHKAHENAAHADFQGANRFGRLAAEAGQLAEQEANAAKQDPKRRPIHPKKEGPVAPAKGGDVAPAKDDAP